MIFTGYVSVILFSIVGIAAACVLLGICHRRFIMLQALLFASCYIAGWETNQTVFYLISAMVFVLMANFLEPGKLSFALHKKTTGLVISLVALLAGFFCFRSNINMIERFAETGTAGRFLLMLIVTMVLLLKNRERFGKAILAFLVGFLLALMGPDPLAGNFRLTGQVPELANGLHLSVLLFGLYVLAPIMGGVDVGRKAKILNSRQVAGELTALVALMFFGIGTSRLSIVVFGIFEQLNLSFGSMLMMESDKSVSGFIVGIGFSIVVSACVVYLIKRRWGGFPVRQQRWTGDSIIVIICFVAMVYAGLGVWSMLIAVCMGLLGVFTERKGISNSFVLVGFIYGSQLERLGRIALMTNYKLQVQILGSLIVGITLLIISGRLLLFRFQLKSRSKKRIPDHLQ